MLSFTQCVGSILAKFVSKFLLDSSSVDGVSILLQKNLAAVYNVLHLFFGVDCAVE